MLICLRASSIFCRRVESSLQRGMDGKEDVIFQNALDKGNRIEAKKPLNLPCEQWNLRAAPPAGVGRLLALVTEYPLDLKTVLPRLSNALAIDLSGIPYGAALAAYRQYE